MGWEEVGREELEWDDDGDRVGVGMACAHVARIVVCGLWIVRSAGSPGMRLCGARWREMARGGARWREVRMHAITEATCPIGARVVASGRAWLRVDARGCEWTRGDCMRLCCMGQIAWDGIAIRARDALLG